MSESSRISFQEIVVFLMGSLFYGLIPIFLVGLFISKDLFDSFWGIGDSSIMTTLGRGVILIIVGAPIGIKFNGALREIWEKVK